MDSLDWLIELTPRRPPAVGGAGVIRCDPDDVAPLRLSGRKLGVLRTVCCCCS